MTNGGPESFQPTPGGVPSEETRRQRELEDKRLGVRIETEGEEHIARIKEVESGRLVPVVERAFAYREGLFFHPFAYQLLESPEVALHLETRFTSAEGSTERGYNPYVDTAIKNRIAREIEIIFDKAEKSGRGPANLTDEEKGEIGQLMSMENAREARYQIDVAFIQRMRACQVAEKAAGVLDGGVTPDKGHWQAALSGDFGEKVDRVLRRIVAAGFDPDERTKDGKIIRGSGLETIRDDATQELKGRLLNQQEKDRQAGKKAMTDKEIETKVKQLESDMQPVPGVEHTIYAIGFENTKVFRKWVSHLMEAADGRMDAVWTAWRLALLWELPVQMGCKKTLKDGKLEYKIADPPIGNDLFTWLMHLEEKRKIEFGWNALDQRDRFSRYLTHTGYPLSLNRIIRKGKKQLFGSFLQQARVENRKGGKSSLWQLWWEEGMQVGGHFGKDPNILPWAATELQPRGLDTDEFPPGSFGLWLLNRSRGHKVVEDIRSTPTLRDISDPNFFSSRVRNWEKIVGEIADDPKSEKQGNVTPENNPKAWWVAGILLFGHRGLKTKDIPLFKDGKVRPELRYTAYYPDEQWEVEGLGRGERRKISVYEILNNAIKCGFLREKDANWIIKELALPAVAGGTVVGNLEK